MAPSKSFDGSWPTPRSMRAPKSVFHFTDMSGLLGIVQNAELWATEASGLNDPTEVTGGLERIYRWMRRHRHEPSVAEVLEVLPEPPQAFGRIYVLSACLDGDDAGQWRSYGDNGRGCAIEIDTSQRLTVKAQRPLSPPRGWPRLLADSSRVSRWTRTVYTDEEVDRVLGGLTTWAERQFAEADAMAAQGDDMAGEASVQYVTDAMLAIAAMLKPPAYHGEAEARTVVTLMSRSPHTSFRASRLGIVQHAALALPRGETDEPDIREVSAWTLPIKSIRLGPHVSYNLTARTVVDLLDRHGYVVGRGVPGHVRVRRSQTPMR